MNGFADPLQQEETLFGTNLDLVRRNLSLTPEERFLRYAGRAPGMRLLVEEAARWRVSRSSDVSTTPAPATSS